MITEGLLPPRIVFQIRKRGDQGRAQCAVLAEDGGQGGGCAGGDGGADEGLAWVVAVEQFQAQHLVDLGGQSGHEVADDRELVQEAKVWGGLAGQTRLLLRVFACIFNFNHSPIPVVVVNYNVARSKRL
jgi:hypothetical protein